MLLWQQVGYHRRGRAAIARQSRIQNISSRQRKTSKPYDSTGPFVATGWRFDRDERCALHYTRERVMRAFTNGLKLLNLSIYYLV